MRLPDTCGARALTAACTTVALASHQGMGCWSSSACTAQDGGGNQLFHVERPRGLRRPGNPSWSVSHKHVTHRLRSWCACPRTRPSRSDRLVVSGVRPSTRTERGDRTARTTECSIHHRHHDRQPFGRFLPRFGWLHTGQQRAHPHKGWWTQPHVRAKPRQHIFAFSLLSRFWRDPA